MADKEMDQAQIAIIFEFEGSRAPVPETSPAGISMNSATSPSWFSGMNPSGSFQIETEHLIRFQALRHLMMISQQTDRPEGVGERARDTGLLLTFLDHVFQRAESQRLAASHRIVQQAGIIRLAVRPPCHPDMQTVRPHHIAGHVNPPGPDSEIGAGGAFRPRPEAGRQTGRSRGKAPPASRGSPRFPQVIGWHRPGRHCVCQSRPPHPADGPPSPGSQTPRASGREDPAGLCGSSRPGARRKYRADSGQGRRYWPGGCDQSGACASAGNLFTDQHGMNAENGIQAAADGGGGFQVHPGHLQVDLQASRLAS